LTTLLNSGSSPMVGGMYKITKKDIGYCDALCYKFHARYGGIPDEDQIQDAREFMCRAAKKWDPELSPRFITYARWWILGAVQRTYYRTNNGYPKHSDVYYQGLEVGSVEHKIKNIRNLATEYEKKELVQNLVATMPKRVETALKRNAEGEKFTDMLSDLGYNTRQALAQKIDRWRTKQGIVKGGIY